MSNYVVRLDFRLRGVDREVYRAMTLLSQRSCDNYLEGDWSTYTLARDFNDRSYERGYSDMYRCLFRVLQDLHEGGHNVLHLDPDTLLMGPVQIFDHFQEMRLFWPTDPGKRRHFDPYLNAGVVYIPASMPALLWNFAVTAAANMREWNDSQDIFNEMFYAHPCLPLLHPELNWQKYVPSPIPQEGALILHFNSTRGASEVLDEMKALVDIGERSS